MKERSGNWERITELLDRAGSGGEVGSAFAGVAADIVGVEHVSIATVVGGRPQMLHGNTEAAMRVCEEQFTLGEGPSITAFEADVPVLVPDLDAADVRASIPAFIASTVSTDIGAMFAFPLRIGAARVGVLTGHRSAPGPLGATAYTDGLLVSSLATIALLEQAAGRSPGRADAEGSMLGVLEDTVQIAAGMVAERLGVTVVEALVRMRARAFAETLTMAEVARRVVARELELER